MLAVGGVGRERLRIVQLSSTVRSDALSEAEYMMFLYAKDFGLKYCGVLNLFEAGMDMLEAYGEIFSLTWDSDQGFDKRLVELIGANDHRECI